MLKIGFNQLTDQFIDWKCLTSCDTDVETKFQQLIDKVCESIDWSLVNLNTLVTPTGTTKDNPIDILNILVKAIEDFKRQSLISSGTTIDLSKILLCGKDTFTPSVYEECLTIVNTCFGTPSVEGLLQALVKRIISYGFWFQQQDAKIKDLESKFNTQQSAIKLLELKIQNCGC